MMMKKLLLLILTINFTFFAKAQIVNIPDANFKAYLVGNAAINTNGDTEIQVTEAQAFSDTIDCSNQSISDLTGIEAFTALEFLYCKDNQLTTIDVSNNTALTELSCYNNSLTTLDVSNNTALTYLQCGVNSLTALDVTNNTALLDLYCNYNSLTTLDVTNNAALVRFQCNNNLLTALDVSNNTALRYLQCSVNSLTALDVTNNTALLDLYCPYNSLTTLDVTNNAALVRILCNNNLLTALDVTNNTALTYLQCSVNSLTALDVTNNTALTYLQCGFNSLTALDVTNNTALTHLLCNENEILTLDVNQNTALKYLECYDNQLTALDVSQNVNLIELWCKINQISSLDVSQNTNLLELFCQDNPLGTLDVSQNLDLRRLNCGINNLTTIDVSQNLDLYFFSCHTNAITEVDISVNTAITNLYCQNNDLVSLNAANTNNSNFLIFRAYNNPNLNCIQVDDSTYSANNWTEIDDSIANFSINCNYCFSSQTNIDTTICDGETYISPNSLIYNVSGIYYDTLQAVCNIDSIIVTNLTVLKNEITNNNGTLEATAGFDTYQWFESGLSIASANTITYTPTESGDYSCEATKNTCISMSNVISIDFDTTGTAIQQLTFENLNIYPNPTNNILNIEVAETLTSIQIMDLTGKTIKVFNAETILLDLSEFTAGIYFLEVANAEKKSVVKIIKQ